MMQILTYTGKKISFEHPEDSVFCIEDIAHALSNICRFTGHTKEFYSVAQHSVHVSHLVPSQHALAALLHDAAEAYVGDMSTPLKSMLPAYKEIENRIQHEIFKQFGLPPEIPALVQYADLVALATEKRFLMPHDPEPWPCLKGIKPGSAIGCANSKNAELMLLYRFKEVQMEQAQIQFANAG